MSLENDHDLETIRKVFRFEADPLIKGNEALDRIEARFESLESSYTEAFELLNWLDQEEKLSSQARAHLRTFWATREAIIS